MQTQGTGLCSKHLYIARSPHQTGSEEEILLTEGCWEAGVEQIHGLELNWLWLARPRDKN